MASPRGKKHAVLMLESPRNGESMALSHFRRKIRAFEPSLDHPSPRTKPIQNTDHADCDSAPMDADGKDCEVVAGSQINAVWFVAFQYWYSSNRK